MSYISDVKNFLSVETSTKTGTSSCSDILSELFPEFDWKQSSEESGRVLHYFETQPLSDSIDFLIYVNIDTHNPSGLALWSETDYDPLNVTFKKGRIYGLGAAHSKVSVVPLLKSISKVLEDTRLNVLFVGGYGRELNMIGAKRTMTELVQKKPVKKVVVTHPTSGSPSYGSVGRTKLEVYFPFSESEKKERDEHDLRENISSQSKIINKNEGDRLNDDVIFKALKSCAHLPSATLLLDFSGGTSTITEAQSVYFEIDASSIIEDSMISRLSNFSNTLEELNHKLIEKFNKTTPEKALHIGKATTTSEGVSFYGYNLIPAGMKPAELNSWYKAFESIIKKNKGIIRIRDTKKAFSLKEKNTPDTTDCLKVTEATVFSRYVEDVLIFGVGEEGLSQKPNEYVVLDDLPEAESFIDRLLADKN